MMSNLVGASIIVAAGLGTMTYMAYSTYTVMNPSVSSTPSEKNVTVQLPQFKESVKFNVYNTEKEMVSALKDNRVVYDSIELSYSLIVSPGKCEVFVLLEDLSQVISDYEIRKCQRMFTKSSE